MRTILAKPRSGPGWFNVVVRMAEKPMIMGDALDERDIPLATAYLIAITPDMQQSAKVRMKAMKDQAERVAEVAEMPSDTAEADTAAPALDLAAAEALYKARCTQCHELDEVDGHGGDDEPAGPRSSSAWSRTRAPRSARTTPAPSSASSPRPTRRST
jgi:cytochrome c5